MGHTALRCYQRFNHAFQQDSSPSLEAFAASPNPISNLNWYPDTGATNHVTSDMGNLTIHADEYTGPDQLRVGNGQGLPIEHLETASLSYPHANFVLNNMLHVPLITKNLLYVSQFTRDNKVCFEFHHSHFYV